jgi:hypothetical protein
MKIDRLRTGDPRSHNLVLQLARDFELVANFRSWSVSMTVESQPSEHGFVGRLIVDRAAFPPYWPQLTLLIDLADRGELRRHWRAGGRRRAEAGRREAAARRATYGLMTQAAVPPVMRANLLRLMQARKHACDQRVIELTYYMGKRLGPMTRGIYARRIATECGLQDMVAVEKAIDTMLATNWLSCRDLLSPLGPSSMLVTWGLPFPGEAEPPSPAKRRAKSPEPVLYSSLPWLGCGRRR